MYKLVLALALSAVAMFGADVTGKWSGSFVITADGETKDDSAYLDLKQDGEKITGTAGPNMEKQFPIRKGTIAGDKITLEVEAHENMTIYINLAVNGDKMTGDAKGEQDGHTMTAKLDLKREK